MNTLFIPRALYNLFMNQAGRRILLESSLDIASGNHMGAASRIAAHVISHGGSKDFKPEVLSIPPSNPDDAADLTKFVELAQQKGLIKPGSDQISVSEILGFIRDNQGNIEIASNGIVKLIQSMYKPSQPTTSLEPSAPPIEDEVVFSPRKIKIPQRNYNFKISSTYDSQSSKFPEPDKHTGDGNQRDEYDQFSFVDQGSTSDNEKFLGVELKLYKNAWSLKQRYIIKQLVGLQPNLWNYWTDLHCYDFEGGMQGFYSDITGGSLNRSLVRIFGEDWEKLNQVDKQFWGLIDIPDIAGLSVARMALSNLNKQYVDRQQAIMLQKDKLLSELDSWFIAERQKIVSKPILLAMTLPIDQWPREEFLEYRKEEFKFVGEQKRLFIVNGGSESRFVIDPILKAEHMKEFSNNIRIRWVIGLNNKTLDVSYLEPKTASREV